MSGRRTRGGTITGLNTRPKPCSPEGVLAASPLLRKPTAHGRDAPATRKVTQAGTESIVMKAMRGPTHEECDACSFMMTAKYAELSGEWHDSLFDSRSVC